MSRKKNATIRQYICAYTSIIYVDKIKRNTIHTLISWLSLTGSLRETANSAIVLITSCSTIALALSLIRVTYLLKIGSGEWSLKTIDYAYSTNKCNFAVYLLELFSRIRTGRNSTAALSWRHVLLLDKMGVIRLNKIIYISLGIAKAKRVLK